jgi:hypothetical protein
MFPQILGENLKCDISRNDGSWAVPCGDGRMAMTRLTVAFRNSFPNEPKT